MIEGGLHKSDVISGVVTELALYEEITLIKIRTEFQKTHRFQALYMRMFCNSVMNLS